MTRRMLIWFALALGCAAALACNSTNSGGAGTPGGSGTPVGTASAAINDYFEQVRTLDDQATERLTVIGNALNATVPEEQQLAAVRDYISQQIIIDKDLRDGLKQLSPPAEVADAHQEAVDSLSAFIELAQKAVDQTASATAAVELITFLNSDEARTISTRLQNGCLGLQQAATQHGVSLTLSCAQ